MTVHDLLIALVVLTALRVFAPDARALTRRLLRAGVRIGATELLTETQEAQEAQEASTPTTVAALPPASRREEG
ncbi:hypothetical protein SLA_4445 [Streptomyces laurentii]|uniref:Uncharacterized protein n=1 Tax=Streptomyces laurentii TaxID=39478 RepID=A0A160P429_STRLU|nr:hypothetical protein SLA_4445 [Streptomyces laurentii]